MVEAEEPNDRPQLLVKPCRRWFVPELTERSAEAERKLKALQHRARDMILKQNMSADEPMP